MSAHGPMPKSAMDIPASVGCCCFAAVTASGYAFAPSPAGLVFAAVLLVILFGTVFAAVHHAEVIAHQIGEPFGTLLLTLSVTIIEVALIATINAVGDSVPAGTRHRVRRGDDRLQRPGRICIFIGGLRYREQDFQVTGANLYLSVLFVLATHHAGAAELHADDAGPVYSAAQLAFVSVATNPALWLFLYTQPSAP